MDRIILASSSPRRRDICRRFDLDPEIILPEIEEIEREDESAYETVMAFAFEKARDVEARVPKGRVIIASDTMVYFQGEKLGKPKDSKEAARTLRKLSGRRHQVISGVCIMEAGTNKKIIDFVETEVKFKDLDDEIISSYIKTGEPMDKAGAYGIQGWGQLLVEEIKGSYLNVVGLPIERIADILDREFSIKVL